MDTLRDLIGQIVYGLVPNIHPVRLQPLKLHAVEPGGIWVENQILTNQVLEYAKAQTAPKTLVVFLPYSQITFLFSAKMEVALSEKSFLGLTGGSPGR